MGNTSRTASTNPSIWKMKKEVPCQSLNHKNSEVELSKCSKGPNPGGDSISLGQMFSGWTSLCPLFSRASGSAHRAPLCLLFSFLFEAASPGIKHLKLSPSGFVASTCLPPTYIPAMPFPWRKSKLWNYQVSIQKTESVLDILNRKKFEPRVREHAIGRSWEHSSGGHSRNPLQGGKPPVTASAAQTELILGKTFSGGSHCQWSQLPVRPEEVDYS